MEPISNKYDALLDEGATQSLIEHYASII